MQNLLNKYRNNFQENLKSIRIKRGLTQADLSQLANYDFTYVGKLERGTASPSFETIIRLSKALKINPSRLLCPEFASFDVRRATVVDQLASLSYIPVETKFFDGLPLALGIITAAGNPVYVNDAFVDFSGLDREHIGELKFWDFISGKPREILKDISCSIQEATTVHYELELDGNQNNTVNLFFYPTSVHHQPGNEMMWIFQFRPSDPTLALVDFPLPVTSIRPVEM